LKVHKLRLVLILLLLAGACLAPLQSAAAPSPQSNTHRKKKKAPGPKTRTAQAERLHQTFVASAELKPMAAQLLEGHSAAAYQGVEAFARKHDGEDVGSLAWLVLGYAYLGDNQTQKAITALEHAQKRAGELGDYVDYFLGQALQAAAQHADVVRLLQDFDAKYPTSLLRADASIIAANGLIATGKPAAATALLEVHRTPARADVEMVLGRAYAKTGNNAKAAESFRLVYYTMPLSAQADEAHSALELLSGISVPAVPYDQRRRRAELLYQGKQYSDSATEYRSLLDNTPSEDARLVLEQVPDVPDEINAQRLFYLAEMSKDDLKSWLKIVNRMRDSASASPWLSEVLYAVANRALLRKDYPTALAFYQENWVRNPQGKYASYAHWKTAWLSFRLKRRDDAKKLFEEQVTNYSTGLEVSGALYWRGRMAEDDHDPATAKAYYLKLLERYRWFYYGELARARLQKLGFSGPAATVAILAKITPAQVPIFGGGPPAGNVRVAKALVLENAALFDLAIRELQAAGADSATSTWATQHIAKIYEEMGREYRSLQYVKRAIPGYYSYDISQMPRPLWESLFPKLYWTDLRKYSLDNSLDPFLVAALIRQESEFNPGAISRAKAMGLMQLLPSVGRKLAKQAKLKGFSTAQLTDPSVNIQLGTTYFKQVLDQYGGQVEYALAAYNAGGNRVDDWRTEQYGDIAEFVESIPFTETREYVQAIRRNELVYRSLYSAP
jgi:soluble lytic murein transglycosylase